MRTFYIDPQRWTGCPSRWAEISDTNATPRKGMESDRTYIKDGATMATGRSGDLVNTEHKSSLDRRGLHLQRPMYLPANWFWIVSFVRWIQEIAVVHRRRRRSPRRPRAALRANQHFCPTILERAARATFPDSSARHRLLYRENSNAILPFPSGTRNVYVCINCGTWGAFPPPPFSFVARFILSI